MMSPKQLVLKVIMLGNSGVGKTCIINKYVKNVFSDNIKPTIGVDFANKAISKDDLKSQDTIMLQIWDTMGLEMFKSINRMYYRGVHGVVLVCDLYNIESFKQLDSWIQEFLQNQDRSTDFSDFGFILLGNKCDKDQPRLVQEEDLIRWCEEQKKFRQIDIDHFIVSAKTGESIIDAFINLSNRMMEIIESKQSNQQQLSFIQGYRTKSTYQLRQVDRPKKKGMCCSSQTSN
ncbi:rab family gtpase [Stylonychia lemnae]|uniref:Rab family gtpase n=1 Tax=Stylonychia lemnae TaxID=5949 RepID=A0A078A1R0_STYLE|nr:rab family gtpase [Stylonychia lemnae]|eukprot:CDW75403.1 rab family gtpase [Stylonychia lemnae]